MKTLKSALQDLLSLSSKNDMKIVRGFNAGVCSLRSLVCLVVILTLSLSDPGLPPAAAATQYADSTATPTWDNGVTANWGAATGGPYTSVWTSGNDAVFEGTAGTVSIGAAGATAHNIIFNTAGYLIQNNTLTLNGSTTITTGEGISAEISSQTSGSASLTKLGAGTLVLSGSHDYTGTTFVGSTNGPNAGILRVSRSGSIPNDAVAIYGGTLDMDNTQALFSIYMGRGASGSTATLDIDYIAATTYIQYWDNNNPNGAVISGRELRLIGGGQRTFDIGNSSAATNDLTVSARITSDSADEGIDKRGSGTLRLSGANEYAGKTGIANGTLSVASLGDVGGAASNLGIPANAADGTIAMGSSGSATLLYTGTGETTDRVLDLDGTTSGATIDQSGTGLLKFTSDMTATGNGLKTLTLQGSTAGTGEIEGAIVDSASATSLTKAGTGTWTLSGASANTYSGATTVNAGELDLSKTAAVNAIAGSLTIGDGTGGANADIVKLINANQIANTSDLTINSSGLLNLNGNSETLDGLSGSGNVDGRSGTPTLTVGANDGTSDFSGVLKDTAGSLALTKSGSGTLILSGANTYSGRTTILAGTLQVGAGGTTGSLSASSAITNNATLAFNRKDAVRQGKDFGTISGTGGLTQSGSGLVIVSSANTYAGATLISAGSVRVSHASALGTGAGGVTNNATLDIGLTGLNIGGTYEQGAASTLRVAVDGSKSGSITATGAVTALAGYGVTLSVTNFVPNGATYTILDGAEGGAIAAPVITVTGSQHVTFKATTIGNDLVLTASRASSGSKSEAPDNTRTRARRPR